MNTLADFVFVSSILFAVGVYGLIVKRNALRLLFAVEIMINAANINFVAFEQFIWSNVAGQAFVLFSIALAAGEAAVILAIVVVAYRLYRDVDVSELKSLEG